MSSSGRNATDPDDTLQEVLGHALRSADPVPDHVLAAARGAWTWRTIDEELAALVFDSATELTGVRDLSGPRQLTFRAADIEIEVMVVDPAQRRVIGQLVPATAATVRLENADGALEQTADRFGRFTFESAPSGPLRFGVTVADGPAVTTDWMLL